MDGWMGGVRGGRDPRDRGQEGLGLRGRGPPRAHSEPGSHSLAVKPAPEAPSLTGQRLSQSPTLNELSLGVIWEDRLAAHCMTFGKLLRFLRLHLKMRSCYLPS